MSATPIPVLSVSDRERFAAKFIAGSEDSCWRWKAGKTEPGYGSFYLAGRQYQAHRIALCLAGSVVTGGHIVEHICGNRACVNPAHLHARSNTRLPSLQPEVQP